MAISDSRLDLLSLRRAPDILAEITAELARGTPAIALISDMGRPERSRLLERLHTYLVRENIRVIVVDSIDGEPIGLRRFCELLVAASPSGARSRGIAEHLAMTFTSPRGGERGLALIIENADVLSAEALGFAERLATASGVRTLPIQVLLVGSRTLQSRLPEAGSFVVKSLARVGTAPGRSTAGTPGGKTAGRGLAATGCVAALFFFLTGATGDRERERERVSAEAASAGKVLAVRSALPAIPGEHGKSPARQPPAEPAQAAQPATLAGRETSPAAQPPAEPAQAAQPATLADRETSPAAQPPAEPAQAAQPATLAGQETSPAGQPPAGPAQAAQPATLAGQEANPAAQPPADTAQAAQPAALAGQETSPAAQPPAEPARTMLPSAIDEREAVPATEHPAGSSTPQPSIENRPIPVQPAQADDTGAAPSTMFATPPSASSREDAAVPPRAERDAAQDPSPAATTAQVLATNEPLGQSAPEAPPAATTGVASPTSTVEPASVAPRAADAANAVSAAASPASAAEQPQAKPSPAAVALLARGDELIAIGDVATARVVYERAAALKSGRGATSTGRTYDPRFLHQIGAVGVVPDPETAAAWYRKGAALGDEAAASLLGNLGSRASQ